MSVGITIAVWFVLLSVVESCTFISITTSTCEGSGHLLITTTQRCDEAVAALALSPKNATNEDDARYPSGCYYIINQNAAVYVNSNIANVQCSTVIPCVCQICNTAAPTAIPTAAPTSVPTMVPTAVPTSVPTSVPTVVPTAVPTTVPTSVPTMVPTAAPTSVPTMVPTAVPTSVPTVVPTAVPTTVPTSVPTMVPTAAPTGVPTMVPTTVPTIVPTIVPTAVPTGVPTTVPTALPTAAPTSVPTTVPTAVPTTVPTTVPTALLTAVPTTVPTTMPTAAPTAAPTTVPTAIPTAPTNVPTAIPTTAPTSAPTSVPPLQTVAPTVSTPLPTAVPDTDVTPPESPTLSPMVATQAEVPTTVPSTEAPLGSQSILKEVDNDVNAAAAVGTIVSSGAAAQASMLALMVGNSCDGSDRELPWILSPLQLTVAGSKYIGTVVGNLILVSATALLFFVAAFVASKLFDAFLKTRTRDKFGLVRTPAAPILIFFILYQGTVFSSLHLLVYPSQVWSLVLGVLSTAVCIGIPLVIAVRLRKGVPRHAVYLRDPLHDERPILTFLIGEGEWVSCCEELIWVERWYSVLRPYRESRVGFVVVDFGGMLLLASSMTARTSTAAACGTVRLLAGLVNTMLFVYAVIAWPHCRTRDNYVNCAILLLQSLASYCLAVGFFSGDPSNHGFLVADILFFTVIAFLLIKISLDLITEVYILFTGRRARLQRYAWGMRHQDTNDGAELLPTYNPPLSGAVLTLRERKYSTDSKYSISSHNEVMLVQTNEDDVQNNSNKDDSFRTQSSLDHSEDRRNLRSAIAKVLGEDELHYDGDIASNASPKVNLNPEKRYRRRSSNQIEDDALKSGGRDSPLEQFPRITSGTEYSIDELSCSLLSRRFTQSQCHSKDSTPSISNTFSLPSTTRHRKASVVRPEGSKSMFGALSNRKYNSGSNWGEQNLPPLTRRRPKQNDLSESMRSVRMASVLSESGSDDDEKKSMILSKGSYISELQSDILFSSGTDGLTPKSELPRRKPPPFLDLGERRMAKKSSAGGPRKKYSGFREKRPSFVLTSMYVDPSDESPNPADTYPVAVSSASNTSFAIRSLDEFAV